ncbi:MAG: hypothetical protein SF187_19280 [Deltaproteobacteria bacterium]|nr:hypothetical protein [Deltaproteobacteria bacterium]
MRADVLTVTYGDCKGVIPLLRSLEPQLDRVERIHICHNGPAKFDPNILSAFAHLPIVLSSNQENLGYGGGINNLWPQTTAPVVIVVNPDVAFEENCLSALIVAATDGTAPVLVAGMLLDEDARVNAFALSLTWDGLGVNVARGLTLPAADTEAPLAAVAPSGALFAVSRAAWERHCGGPLFVDSLFLYLEDLALGLKVRRQGGGIVFCSAARAVHRFSDTTGKRSALKLFYVERNRLWLQRALAGRVLCFATFPFTVLRYFSYALHMLRAKGGGSHQQAGPGFPDLLTALLRGWFTGLFLDLPRDLVPYLGENRDGVSLRRFVAPLREQLRDPTA